MILARKKRQSTCGPNEVESSCALLQKCQPSCDRPQGTTCVLMCSPNPCVCKDGYIRLSRRNLTCVEKTQCKKHIPFSLSFIADYSFRWNEIMW